MYYLKTGIAISFYSILINSFMISKKSYDLKYHKCLPVYFYDVICRFDLSNLETIQGLSWEFETAGANQ